SRPLAAVRVGGASPDHGGAPTVHRGAGRTHRRLRPVHVRGRHPGRQLPGGEGTGGGRVLREDGPGGGPAAPDPGRPPAGMSGTGSYLLAADGEGTDVASCQASHGGGLTRGEGASGFGPGPTYPGAGFAPGRKEQSCARV